MPLSDKEDSGSAAPGAAPGMEFALQLYRNTTHPFKNKTERRSNG
jgi:hypothetical protein